MHGLDQIYTDSSLGNGAGAAGFVWLKAIGLRQVRGTVCVLAAALLVPLTGILWQSAYSAGARWWMGFPALLMFLAGWTILGPVAGAPWTAVLSISLSLGLFLTAVGLVACEGAWRRELGDVKEDFQRPGVFAVGVLTTAFLIAHVVVGIGGKKTFYFGVVPHLVCAVVAAALVVSLVAMVLHRHPEIRTLTRPALALVSVLPMEIMLGIWCYLLNMRQPAEAWGQLHQMTVVIAGELHLLGGGVLGALSLLMTLRARTQLTARVIASPLKRGAVEA